MCREVYFAFAINSLQTFTWTRNPSTMNVDDTINNSNGIIVINGFTSKEIGGSIDHLMRRTQVRIESYLE